MAIRAARLIMGVILIAFCFYLVAALRFYGMVVSIPLLTLAIWLVGGALTR